MFVTPVFGPVGVLGLEMVSVGVEIVIERAPAQLETIEVSVAQRVWDLTLYVPVEVHVLEALVVPIGSHPEFV